MPTNTDDRIILIPDRDCARWHCGLHLDRPAVAIARLGDRILRPVCSDCLTTARDIQIQAAVTGPCPRRPWDVRGIRFDPARTDPPKPA